MIKNKLDYKLINILILTLIIFLIYQTHDFWIIAVSTLKKCLLPFFIAFIIAYFLNPIISKLERNNISRKASSIIIFLLLIGIFIFLICILWPILIKQITNIISFINYFLQNLNLNNINISYFQKKILKLSNQMINNYDISKDIVNIINTSINFFSLSIIIATLSLYLLIDFNTIKKNIKKKLKKNKKIYHYLSVLDKELNNYISGFIKITIISFFEYLIIYKIINHPYVFLLAFLASIMNLIPYFGGIIVGIIAFISALSVSKPLAIKTIIVFIVFSIIDGNIINPLVYNKTNKIHPITIIISIFVVTTLLGPCFIFIAIPIIIIIKTTYNYFKKDIKTLLKYK